MAVSIKYNLSCAGLTENLLKDIYPVMGLASNEEIDEHLADLDKEKAENTTNLEYPPFGVALLFFNLSFISLLFFYRYKWL